MITLPEDFIETKFPGYFWSLEDNWLYSIKSGVLKPLSKSVDRYMRNTGSHFTGWQVSHLGEKKYLSEEYLLRCAQKHKRKPKEEQHQVIPIWRKIFGLLAKMV